VLPKGKLGWLPAKLNTLSWYVIAASIGVQPRNDSWFWLEEPPRMFFFGHCWDVSSIAKNMVKTWDRLMGMIGE